MDRLNSVIKSLEEIGLVKQAEKLNTYFAAFDKTLNQAAKEENIKVPFFSF